MRRDVAEAWRGLSVFDATWLYDRWTLKPGGPDDDALLGKDRVHRVDGIVQHWTVKTRQELVRLLGALQYFNQRCTLWLRGEAKEHAHARPSRYREEKNWHLTTDGLQWISRKTTRSRLLRERRPLARLAILQHYGAPTSFLDLTLDIDVALAFAWWRPRDDMLVHPGRDRWSNISVYATPRVTEATNVLHDLDLCVVDLRAELPSFCLRPHAQSAGFVARASCALADLEPRLQAESCAAADLDLFRVARIRLAGQLAGPPRGERTRNLAARSTAVERLFPRGSAYCLHCPTTTRKAAGFHTKKDHSDLNGDLLVHKLHCLGEGDRIKGLTFPNFYRKRRLGAV